MIPDLQSLARQSRLFGYADLGKTGLGNRLFSWARCEIFCRDYQVPMLALQWVRLKIGPILRRERDKRFYFHLFHNGPYIRNPRRWWLLARSLRIHAHHLDNLPQLLPQLHQRNLIVEFSGMADDFLHLPPHRDFLKSRLYSILRPPILESIQSAPSYPHIAAHVRRGDMYVLQPGQSASPGATYAAIHTGWYVHAINQLRQTIDSSIPVIVYTDGRPHEIAPLLQLPHVHLAPANSSIVDMLSMSRAKLLLATPGSTFSAWAAFFGKIPSLWFPIDTRFSLTPDQPHYESHTDLAGNIPASFLQIAKQQFASLS